MKTALFGLSARCTAFVNIGLSQVGEAYKAFSETSAEKVFKCSHFSLIKT